MNFDLVFSNPPYNKTLDLKIMNEVWDCADEFVVIHPSTWLLDIKGSFNLYNIFRNKIENKVQSFQMFNGCNEFGIVVNTPIVISHLNKKYQGEVHVDYFHESFSVDSVFDVTKFGAKYKTLVEPMMIMAQEYIKKHGSIWSNRVSAEDTDDSLFYCQLADIIGNIDLYSKTNQMVKDDFYTMTIKSKKDNIGIRKTTIKNTYAFKTEEERTNFLNYCNTDFARFLLAIIKNNTHIDSGETNMIPWLDFTQEWNDEKLFDKFNISEEQQDLIRDFLPDYYGIRK